MKIDTAAIREFLDAIDALDAWESDDARRDRVRRKLTEAQCRDERAALKARIDRAMGPVGAAIEAAKKGT